MSGGYIYVLSNPIFASDIYKVGLTHRSPEGRIDKLGCSTGVPTPFVLEYAEYVQFARQAEKLIHVHLTDYRVNDRREFFRCDAKKIINVIIEIADDLRVTYAVNCEEFEAADNSRESASIVNFGCPSIINNNEKNPEFGICNFSSCYEKAVGIAVAGVRYCLKHISNGKVDNKEF